MYSTMDDEKQRKNNYLTDKMARVGSRRRAILSYNKFEIQKKMLLNCISCGIPLLNKIFGTNSVGCNQCTTKKTTI